MHNILYHGGLWPLVTALVLFLAACQQQSPPGDDSAGQSATGSAVKTAVETREVLTEAASTPLTAPAPPPEQQVIERPPLDLTLSPDILGETEATGFPEQPARLPDLFAPRKQAGTTVSGELLFREGEEATLDTMNGARITVQIPVDK